MRGTFLAVPGQGSQTLGMGRQLVARHPAARATFDESVDALGFDMREVMWGTSADALTATEYAQPAIVLLAVAAMRAWQAVSRPPADVRWVTGHSVGALAAAIAVESLTFVDGIRLARARGQLMGSAPGAGAMLAVAVTSDRARDDVARAASSSGLDIACINSARQIVLSGAREAISEARARFGSRCRLLDVSHGFHSSLMDPIVERWASEVAALPFREPRTPMLSALSGRLLHAADEIEEDVRHGVRETVRWDLVTAVANESGCRAVILGNGHTLTRLWRGEAVAKGATVVDDGFRNAAHAA
ncbi:acyltransferase domain-containing protein [Microbacterium sp. BWR-S6Y]|uniref:ACP S-malonyltransferase n=1 Tax=Microbacterium sp. BWR-S6Y TaxID=3232073 RepID=UPI0035283693